MKFIRKKLHVFGGVKCIGHYDPNSVECGLCPEDNAKLFERCQKKSGKEESVAKIVLKKREEAAKATRTAKARKQEGNGKKREAAETDVYGFRIGTKRSDVMAMLKSGKHTYEDIVDALAPMTRKQIRTIAEIAGKGVIESKTGKLVLK